MIKLGKWGSPSYVENSTTSIVTQRSDWVISPHFWIDTSCSQLCQFSSVSLESDDAELKLLKPIYPSAMGWTQSSEMFHVWSDPPTTSSLTSLTYLLTSLGSNGVMTLMSWFSKFITHFLNLITMSFSLAHPIPSSAGYELPSSTILIHQNLHMSSFLRIPPWCTVLAQLETLWIGWVDENMEVIKFKKWVMNFENHDIRVISPLDMSEGRRYV